MNETLRQVLAELPEIRERADKATLGPWCTIPDDTISEYVGNEEHGDFIKCMYLNRDGNAEFIAHAREDVPKLCSSLQAAAKQIERLEQVKKLEVGWVEDVADRLTEENERLQAENEQLNTRLKAAETVIAQAKVYLDMISELQREGGKRG